MFNVKLAATLVVALMMFSGAAVMVGTEDDDAITNTNYLFGAGYNSSGQLGTGDTTNRDTFVQYDSLYGNIIKVVVDGNTVYFINENGVLYGVGYNDHGQLVTGDKNSVSTPVQISTTVKDVFASNGTLWVLLENGKLYASGSNENNKMGNPTLSTSDKTSLYEVFTGFTIKDFIPDRVNCYVLTEDNKLYSVGANTAGQIGNGTSGSSNVSTPYNVASDVVKVMTNQTKYANSTTVLYENSSGEIYGFGYNGSNQLSAVDTNPVTTPIQIASSLGTIVDFAPMGSTIYVLNSDHELYAVGSNTWGNFGNGTTTGSSSFVQIATTLGDIDKFYICTGKIFVFSNGNLYFAGYNGSNQRLFLQVAPSLGTISDVVSDSNPSSGAVGNTFLILENKDVYAYGRNSYGSLGNGSNSDVGMNNPIKISGDFGEISQVVCTINNTFLLAAPPTATVTVTPNDSDYGSVSPASITDIEPGDTITVSGNTITYGETVVTATPAEADAQYTYAFSGFVDSNSDPVTGTVTVNSDMDITAVFTATTNQYAVTISPNDPSYGSVSPSSLTVDYGTAITVSGTSLTIGSQAITATASDATAQYTYAFDSWTVPGAVETVTGPITITGTFTATVNEYTVTIESADVTLGTVDVSEVQDVPYGTAITVSGDTVTIGETVITATVIGDGLVTKWSVSDGATVTGDMTITASFVEPSSVENTLMGLLPMLLIFVLVITAAGGVFASGGDPEDLIKLIICLAVGVIIISVFVLPIAGGL